ncbi:MAG: PhzF family phenazine biosynthesis protein [Acidobacteriota bacterium]
MARTFVQVDAFTDRPFRGNPAAVFLLDGPADPLWMQLVAREMNLSETAFLHPRRGGFDLRWFTPAVEVDLCGHATLASAHALWTEGHADPATPLRFFTRSGELGAEREGDWITLDFPATGPAPCPPPEGLLEALGAQARYVGKTRFDYLVELAAEGLVRDLKPDGHRLKALGVRGVIVTAKGGEPYDFVSRFFAPGAGIEEDPVTGSAHCALGPYWQGKTGRADFLAYQASARGGEVRVRVRGDRVLLSGRAVTVVRGELL